MIDAYKYGRPSGEPNGLLFRLAKAILFSQSISGIEPHAVIDNAGPLLFKFLGFCGLCGKTNYILGTK